MKYGSKTRSILTKLVQISAISFISFDVNNRRKKLDAILFGLCCKEIKILFLANNIFSILTEM